MRWSTGKQAGQEITGAGVSAAAQTVADISVTFYSERKVETRPGLPPWPRGRGTRFILDGGARAQRPAERFPGAASPT